MPILNPDEDGYQLVIALDQLGIQIDIDDVDGQGLPAQLAERLEHVVAQMAIAARVKNETLGSHEQKTEDQ